MDYGFWQDLINAAIRFAPHGLRGLQAVFDSINNGGPTGGVGGPQGPTGGPGGPQGPPGGPGGPQRFPQRG